MRRHDIQHAAQHTAADAHSDADSTATATEPATFDRFGNRILGTPGQQYGRLGQYRITSTRDGGVARVCGEAETTKHLPFWEYDAGERRYVCRVCWPTSQQPQSQPIDE